MFLCFETQDLNEASEVANHFDGEIVQNPTIMNDGKEKVFYYVVLPQRFTQMNVGEVMNAINWCSED